VIYSNGGIVFTDYKRLEKIHGVDGAFEILNEIILRLETKHILYRRHLFSDKSVREQAFALYEQIIEERGEEFDPHNIGVEDE
jgi:hypothetical protein|tara:strand:- start:401 stop:649 length:249 start_codon:yes stop_codon:yes gene_type:complete